MGSNVKAAAGWGVHLLTASGLLVGLTAALFIAENRLKEALALMVITIIIDAIDGPMARSVNIKENVPQFDGYLLDNIVDFFTWVIVPVLFLIKTSFLPPYTATLAAGAILLSSAYQFCCTDVKDCVSTFKRWPSAWSVVVILAYTWHMDPWPALTFLGSFVILSFIPIYYIHPFQKNVVFNSKLPVFALQIAAVSLMLSMLFAIYAHPVEYYLLTLAQQLGLSIYFCICFYHTMQLKKKQRG